MDNLSYIRSEIERLYKTNPNIHVSVKLTRPRVIVEGAPAIITGVYKNIFQIEENDGGTMTRHTLKYVDVLIGHVFIAELNCELAVGDVK